MDTPPSSDDPEHRFRQLHRATYADLHRFAQRRCGPDTCEDVVAETYLVAWRRLDDVPADGDAARAWLFGVARNVVLNARRSESRRTALGVRLADVPGGSSLPADEAVAVRLDLHQAWQRLSERHQEVLTLAVLDGLDSRAASAVLGISPVAFRLRLTRARRALRAHLDHSPSPRPTAEPQHEPQHLPQPTTVPDGSPR